MNLNNWYRLSFFEQLSNIAGEVSRLIDNHEKYIKNDAEDYSDFYLGKINELIEATFSDVKNDIRRKQELQDEVDEIKRYLQGDFTANYILSYWNEYTQAIS